MLRQRVDVRHHTLAVDATHDQDGRRMPRPRPPCFAEVGEPGADGDRFQRHPHTGAGLADGGHREVALAAHPLGDAEDALPARDAVHHNLNRLPLALGAHEEPQDATESPEPSGASGRCTTGSPFHGASASSRGVSGADVPTHGRYALSGWHRALSARLTKGAPTSSPPGDSILAPPAASVSQFTAFSIGPTAARARDGRLVALLAPAEGLDTKPDHHGEDERHERERAAGPSPRRPPSAGALAPHAKTRVDEPAPVRASHTRDGLWPAAPARRTVRRRAGGPVRAVRAPRAARPGRTANTTSRRVPRRERTRR